MSLETRFSVLTKSHPERAKELLKMAQEDLNTRWKMYVQLAHEDNGPASN
jgi:pyruvate-ferredoxin/flavodoxin oxidoreductase